jgi:hypothetical protein
LGFEDCFFHKREASNRCGSVYGKYFQGPLSSRT